MMPAVLAAFPAFTDKLEGHCDCMYVDVKGLVTTARGNLIDLSSDPAALYPWAPAMTLPWQLNGAPATQAQVRAEWLTVKGRQDLAGKPYPSRRAITTLRLTNDAIDALTNERLEANDVYLSHRFPGWPSFPADAQLAIHSLAWACGPAFNFPKLVAAVNDADWAAAADEIAMSGTATNPGIIPRNRVNRLLLLTAARGLQPFDELHYLDEPDTDPEPAGS